MNVMGEENNFLAISEIYSNPRDSKIAIVQAPYEHTVSYGRGAAGGPSAIVEASAFVEFYDDEFDRELCFEKGIATFEEIDFNGAVDKTAIDLIESNVSELISLNKFVVTLGGEHTISTAPISAHFKAYPEMSILHFDAHSDLRFDYEGSLYSHASFMSRVIEFFPPEKVTQVGIRALCKEEADLIKSKRINTFFASAIRRGKYGSDWKSRIVNTLGKDVYVTFDIDYFDPSLIPSTGTPEPDGFFYSETLDIFRLIQMEGKRIVGFDIVELAPIEGLNHPNLIAARLVYKLLNIAFAETRI